MKHMLVVTGGHLNIDFTKEYIKTLSYDKVFAVDKGLEYVDAMNMNPDYIVGDFDTVNTDLLAMYEEKITNEEISTCIERHPVMKDETDTELALDIAIEAGADCITLLAATGSRLDHVLANMGLLIKLAKHNVKMYIVDETNRIQIMTRDNFQNCIISKKEQFGKYVSLVPITPCVKGVTCKGALYPLCKEDIYSGESRTVSNEIEEEYLEISISDGMMLVIESRDKY